MSTLRTHLAQRSRLLLKASFPLAVYSYQREQWRTFSESVASVSHPHDITLYQYKICPYCSRPKTLLDFLRVPYRAVEVNPLTKSQISFSKDYKKVPIANLNGEVVKDSSAIVEALGRVLANDPKIALMMQSLVADDSEKWAHWSEKLAVMIYPNITRNFGEAWECFRYTGSVESWNFIERYSNRILGPVAMYFANGKIKKKYGIVNEREEMLAYLQQWSSALKGKYLHGENITMPDLLVYSVLRSVSGLKTFEDIMEKDSVLHAWYIEVDKRVHG